MSSFRTSYGLVAGEPAMFAGTVEGWAGEVQPTLVCGGFGTTALSMLGGQSWQFHRKVALASPALSIEAGGYNTMGNDVAIASIEATAQAFRTQFGPRQPPFTLIGLSMGFCDLMAWARTHQDQVAGVIGCVGLSDLTEQWTANRDLGSGYMGQAEINTAYGGLYVPATHGPTHSPIEYAGDCDFPITYFYSTNDPLIPPSSALAFGELPNVELVNLGAVGHGNLAIQKTHEHPSFLSKVLEYSSST